VAEQGRRALTGRIEIGIGLISFTVLIVAVAVSLIASLRESLGLTLLAAVAAIVLIGVLWTSAIRNGHAERVARLRLKDEHPGALVERVRLWMLPHGRVEPDLPVHFLIADAREISFETIEQTVLLRIPVEDLGFADLVAAQGDRVRDRALTLIYGDEQLTVQFFTITYASMGKLRARLRKAIGWPVDTP
jgi:hypothetical protein